MLKSQKQKLFSVKVNAASGEKKESKFLRGFLKLSPVFVGLIMVFYYFYPAFASPPSSPYAPGETTDPSCSPGDTNCTVYPPFTTTLTGTTAITMGTSSIRFAYDSTNYSSLTVAADGALTVSSTNSATTTFINKIYFLSNAYFNTIASGTWNGSVIGIAYGGTNSSTIAANGSIVYSDGTRYNATEVGTLGYLLMSAGGGRPVWINSTTLGTGIVGSGTAGQFPYYATNGTAVVGTSTLFITPTSLVGIGTTTPTQKLAVVGNISNILDPSNTSSISQVSTVTVGTVPRGLFVSGRYLYVANYNDNTISVVDVSNSSAPVQIATTSVDTNPISTFVSGRYLYVANYNSNTVSVVDISNPSAPRKLSSVAVEAQPTTIYVSGHYAYVVNHTSNTISVVDVSNPYTPVQIATTSVGNSPRSVYVSGRYAYVANYLGNTMSVVDVSNPATPVEIATVAVGANPRGVYVSGRYAYVANFSGATVSVVDVSNPAVPVQIATAPVGTSPMAIYVSGRYAYVANFSSANISIVDVSSSSAPSHIATVPVGTNPYSIFVSGRNVYVANYGSNTISIVDIPGAEVSSLIAHSAEVGNIQSRNDILAQGNIMAGTGLMVGAGGIMSQGGLSIFASTTGSTSSIFSIDSAASSSIIKVLANGRVGIGTSSPQALLSLVNDSNTQLHLNRSGASGQTGTLRIGNQAGLISNSRGGINNGVLRNDGVLHLTRNLVYNSGDWELEAADTGGLLEVGAEGISLWTAASAAAGTKNLGIILMARDDGDLVIPAKVGIGVPYNDSTVTTPLYVQGNTSEIMRSVRTSTLTNVAPTGLRVAHNSTNSSLADGFGMVMQFAIDSPSISETAIAEIGGVRSGGDTSGALVFSTYNAGVSTEKLRITPSGLIGINSTSPIASFALQGTSTSNLFAFSSSTGANLLRLTTDGGLGFGTTPATTGAIRLENNTGIYARRADNAADIGLLSLNTSNQIVIGVNASAVLLSTDLGFSTDNTYDIGGGTRSPRHIFARSNIAAGTSTAIARLTVQGDGTANPFSVVTSTAAASSMFTILTNGRVGINTSSPVAMLALQGSDGINPLEIASSTGASMFRILTNGNIGIGNSAPLGDLEIGSTAESQGLLGITASTAGTSDIFFNNSSQNRGVIRYTHSSDSMALWSAGSERMRISSTGLVGVGTTTPLSKLTVVGSGNNSTTIAFNTYSASGTSTFKIDDAGNAFFANDGIYYEASSSVAYINSLETGPLNFDDNAGMVTWVDMLVSSSVAGTPNSYTAAINDNPMLMIYAESNGSGGIANQTISINTSTTSTYKLYIDAGASTTAGLGVNGFIKASGYIAGTTTLDIAETYPLDPECEANGNCPTYGEVVCSGEDASSTVFIKKCSAAYADNIIGVISENPGFILGGYDVSNVRIKGLYPTSFRPVALGGRVPVKVSNANGAIKEGDYLTSSAEPGLAVKAIEPGRVIGIALQSVEENAETGTVIMFVNPHWSAGSLTEESIGADLPDFADVVLDKFTLAIKNSLRKLGLAIKNGIATVKELFADKVTTQQLCVGSTCVNEQQLQDILNRTNVQPAPSNPSPVIPENEAVNAQTAPTSSVSAPESAVSSTTNIVETVVNETVLDTASSTPAVSDTAAGSTTAESQ
ncbi:MAG: beta-propeller fold lactonase family protein [Candidatus Magasanikbacteria bacterium]|nr:beta-propeller fold lactonase family protein [Candidatus Magasanikbacteria bacterium]